MDLKGLSDMQLDALREIGNMGAATAATALNSLVKRRVEISVPSIEVVPLEELPSYFGGESELITGVFLHLFGKIPGSVLLVFRRDDGLRLVDMLMGKPDGSTKTLSGLDLSAFLESGNILVGSYLTAIGNFFSTKFIPSTPSIVFNIAGVIVDFIQMSVEQKVSHAIVVGTEFEVEGKRIKGEFVMLVGDKSLEEMLERLDSKIAEPKAASAKKPAKKKATKKKAKKSAKKKAKKKK